jgi:hypothetical protein
MKMPNSASIRILVSILLLATGILFNSVVFYNCKHESITDGLPEVCFENEILPIVQGSCGISGCHSGSEEPTLRTYEDIRALVEPGEPDRSEFYQVITDIWSDEMMPPDAPLSQKQRELIRLWIEQGALNTTCPTPPDTSDTSLIVQQRACYDKDIQPILNSSCAISGCHDNITSEGDYIFTSYNNTMQAVTSGKPTDSKLYEVLVTSESEDKMPPAPRNALLQSQIDSIYNWIAYGAINEDCIVQCDTQNVSYSGSVSQVLQNNCNGCHSGSTPSGGLNLTNYSTVSVVAANGKLTGSVNREVGYIAMPAADPLDNCSVRKINIWVDQGYPNN